MYALLWTLYEVVHFFYELIPTIGAGFIHWECQWYCSSSDTTCPPKYVHSQTLFEQRHADATQTLWHVTNGGITCRLLVPNGNRGAGRPPAALRGLPQLQTILPRAPCLGFECRMGRAHCGVKAPKGNRVPGGACVNRSRFRTLALLLDAGPVDAGVVLAEGGGRNFRSRCLRGSVRGRRREEAERARHP